MKRNVLLFAALALLLASEAAAQDNAPRPRKKYLNLSYSMPSLSAENSPELKSDYGLAFTTGRSYYLHRKPIVGLLRFGIDATWLDLNYGKYDTGWTQIFVPTYGYRGGYSNEYHQIEIGMQVGPSVTVTPLRSLAIHAYFRYAPTFAFNITSHADGECGSTYTAGGYASFFVAGGSVSWGAIGLGAEARWGSGKYSRFSGGDEDEFGVFPSGAEIKTTGWRVYLNFRF